MRRNKVLVIVGPTAAGKSRLAIEIAKKIPSEIISADSMQVYKGLDIGTAKVSILTRKQFKHHLIDVTTIDKPFNVVKYQKVAKKIISQVQKREMLPIIVGGGGLYVRATIYKLKFPPNAKNPKIRKELEQQLEQRGITYLQEKLNEKDPVAYKTIDLNNSRRLIRALEVIETTSRPYSSFREDWHNWEPQYKAMLIGLTMPRRLLYERINNRVDKMMNAGLLNETKQLIAQGLKDAMVAKQALGYKELIEYLDNKVTLEQAVENLKKRTRNYAKRQITWFKKDPNIKWFDISKISIQKIVHQIIRLLICTFVQ